MMDEIMGIVPKIYECVKRFVEVDLRQGELDNVVNEVAIRIEDLNIQARNEERNPGKKRKRVLDAYIRQTQRYRESAQLVLNSCQEEQWMLKRIKWVPTIERHQREGQELLRRGSQLIEEGLTYDVIRTRGEMLPLEEDQYVGTTVRGHLESAVTAMMDGSAPCIGIYGQAGAGKTNLMKHLYNKVLEDRVNFKAVFWATASEPSDHDNYHKALQKCVADGMWIDLDDGVVHDEVRSAGKITARLQEIGPGRVVVFLDNVKREFPAYEVLGIPSLVTPSSTSSATAAAVTASESDATSTANCILVFTTRSKDVCNWMRCDLPLKMDLLEEKEAQELFLHEVRCGGDNMENGRVLSKREKKEIQEIAVQVANQCARMPLAIIIIARSMAKKDDLREWRNRLNELIGYIATIHDDEAKILEHLKFGYNSLKDRKVQRCFLDAARMLGDDREVSKVDIIERWKVSRLIGMDRRGELADDQGHAILNQLERMCLLQVVPDHQSVTMNKWICKMAASVS